MNLKRKNYGGDVRLAYGGIVHYLLPERPVTVCQCIYH